MNSREIELKAMMVKALDGDAAAYRTLLRLLVPQLRGFFRRRISNEDAAEDLVQETLIAIHAKRATYDRDRPFSAWLFAIARYKLADHFRKGQRLNSFDELDEQLAGPEFESASLAGIDVTRLLDGLSPKQRGAIRATKIEGLSLAEAASSAGMTESDVKMSVYRGLKRLSARVQGRAR